jgi:hypothetical protein
MLFMVILLYYSNIIYWLDSGEDSNMIVKRNILYPLVVLACDLDSPEKEINWIELNSVSQTVVYLVAIVKSLFNEYLEQWLLLH